MAAIWIEDEHPLVAILSYVRDCDHGVSMLHTCVACEVEYQERAA